MKPERELQAMAYHLADIIETKAQVLINAGMSRAGAIKLTMQRMAKAGKL